tara:strand:+ start:185158 stop:185316 length:159 start_codon:yes stop_codon:yes gene_type:complete
MKEFTLSGVDAIPLHERDKKEKWSTRRTIAFSLLVCGAFWVAVAFAIFKWIA